MAYEYKQSGEGSFVHITGTNGVHKILWNVCSALTLLNADSAARRPE